MFASKKIELFRWVCGYNQQLDKATMSISVRRSSIASGKKAYERHDRSLWWFVETDNGVFIEKGTGRVKFGGKELLAVTNINASSSQREILKVNILDAVALYKAIYSKDLGDRT